MISRFITFAGLLLATTSCLASKAAAEDAIVQVLLQGPDNSHLTKALLDRGGDVTHLLPVINGIGGTIRASELDGLLASPGVSRVIEDYNPPEDPEPRECAIDGALELRVKDDRVEWDIHNFSAHPVTITELDIDAAETGLAIAGATLGALDWQSSEQSGVSHRAIITEETTLPTGVTTLVVDFSESAEALEQSQLAISVATPECEATLYPAYPDNSNDFYFARVLGADKLHQRGITGAGVAVAVVDSGLWAAAPLANNTLGQPRILSAFDAISNHEGSEVSDRSGHGTHITSVLAHSGAARGEPAPSYKGVAPDAQIIPVGVFSRDGNGDFLDILRGIQWVIDNRDRYDIRIMNMSLAAVARFNYWDDPINQAVLKAWQAGVLVVAAAGNEGPDWGSVGSPGNNPYVLTVGAITDSWTPTDFADDYIPDFSSRGPTPSGHVKPDVVAPGGHMTGLAPANSALVTENPNWLLKSGDFVSTGSSQAAAAVAGVAALLIGVDPTLTNEEVKCLITTSARPAINRNGQLSYSQFTQGAGYVDAARALTIGRRRCSDPHRDIDAAVLGQERLYGPAEVDSRGEPRLPSDEGLVAEETPLKGLSETRVWGIKEHVERLDIEAGEPTQNGHVPVNWAAAYDKERRLIEALEQADQ